MRLRLSLLLVTVAFVLTACGGGTNDSRAVDAPPAVNNDGNPVTAVITAVFSAATGEVPLPNDLLLGTDDLTLNIPFDPADVTAGTFAAVNSLDGWSTVAPWSAPFSSAIDASTVVAGDTVRMFEVTRASGSIAVTGIIRELTPNVEYVATVSTANALAHSVVIIPTQPLTEVTAYMVVLTNGITDTVGNDATQDQQYFIASRTSPLIDASGNSTDPLLDNATAQALEPLRQLTNAQQFAAASAGIDPADIVVSFSATTQSITPGLSAARAQASAQFSQLAPTGLNTSAIGAAGIADIYIGVMNVPYYLAAPTNANPTAPLTGFWEAAPGGYAPPFDAFGLDPTSTNLTLYNPFPVVKSTEGIPVLMTLPNAGSGMTMPDSGWPVAIFLHGITRNRTDMLALADSMALAGFAVVAIDHPMHGIASTVDPATGTVTGPEANPFYIENTPLAPFARERTFDVDYVNNLTGAPGGDGFIDASGAHAINLTSLRTARDQLRQASTDLSTLALTIPTMDATGDGVPDFDGARIHFVSQSWGGFAGTPFLAVEPTVNVGALNVVGAGLAGLAVTSPAFGPSILAGLSQLGIQPGSELFNLFLVATQTVLDAADPINWGAQAAATNAILIQNVVGSDTSLFDQVVPPSDPSFPLTGSEPLARVMGLQGISQTTQDLMGIRGIARFVAGNHGSLLDPSGSLEVTAEMQGEVASLFATDGTLIQVTIPSVLQGN